ncbi:Hypothetical Protein FCC1311_016652 [Hondaea fermentalgiana]|uniref:Uncharacterized protein n=1 Tax=Hondaea fermentalgiana TaxID=2315210 RepID=A0A2R5G340_9STRA|nr:Hypothetical Protein FCC1311_016652 [Hondaea fermentalgiana]|eukprot:GBG25447.1 Hypothetical Protein FCC1311_016652 [Hondaea fermentalgiana]
MQPGYGWGGKSLASASMTEKKVADRSAVLGEDFRAGAKDALEKVRRGFSELQADNPSLQLNSPSDWEIEVHLANTDNRFLVQIDFDKNELIFVSPESGGRTYFLDAESGRWRDRTDGHGFDGLLTRDVMRHCYGVPNFML